MRSRTPRWNASTSRSTSTTGPSSRTPAGSPTAGTGALPCTSNHSAGTRSISPKTPPTAWAIIPGRSVVRRRDSTRRGPSQTSQTLSPSAMANPDDPQIGGLAGRWPRGSSSSVSSRARPDRATAPPRGLMQTPPQEGSDERSEEQVGDGPIVATPGVGRDHDVGLAVQHWLRQSADPFVGHRRHIRFQEHEPTRLEATGDGPGEPQHGAVAPVPRGRGQWRVPPPALRGARGPWPLPPP